ncbi:hypothetical protein D3P08_18480 [Paenibacillus nanensis]|uniref:SLH domain-containing protein n=1 Tax=Paenibacillus nanensis TaxID=393251 RepID=A0A3A1US53_9BACL|nr:S-layer homology domain-containing protein [Paenibacillus nanensis]RIX51065.1 hypothetical protein D3P08_18480 [Paenibacillus nanensis]
MRETSNSFSLEISKQNSQQPKHFRGGDKKVMKKSLSLFVASSMVVSMFAGAAYAADAKNPGEYLNELGVIQGNGTDLKEDQSWKRQDVIVLLSRLLGEEDEAQDAETTHEFTDVTNSFYDGFISWAVEEGLVEGKGNGKFGFNAELKNQEFYAIVLRAFGHDTTGEGYAEVPELAVKYGFATEETDFSAIPTRGETYATIVKALETEVPGTGKKLGVILGLIKEEAPQAAAVQSINALNATQVAVKFTAAVDKTAAETVTNYAIGTNNPDSVSLSADGLTATLTFGAGEVEVQNAVAVIEPIVSAADVDKTTAKYTQIFSYKDEVKPEFVSVEAKTNNTVATSVTVKASEPINAAVVKINGSYYSANFGGTDTAKITGVALEVNKTHTIELINLTDKATVPNVTVLSTKTFSVVVDQVAPTATLSTSSDKTIVVTFSKPMDSATVIAGLTNAVKNEVLANVATLIPTAVNGSNDTKFEIKVNEPLFASTATRTLNVAFPGSIKDSLGNSIAAGTQAVVLSKDVVKPAPTGYRVVKDGNGNITKIEVNFSEALAAGTPGAVSIVNSNGVNVTGSLLGGFTAVNVTAGDKKVVYNANVPGKASGQFAFSFPANLVTDTSEAANKSDAFNYTLDLGAGSTTFSLPANPITVTTSFDADAKVVKQVLTVNFGAGVKGGAVANSATDLNNYTIAGKPLPAGTIITLNGTQDVATITLPAGSIAKTDANAVVTVSNILSLNGAALNSYVGTIGVTDNTKAKLTSAVLNSDGSLTVGFDEALDAAPGLQNTDLKVSVNGSALNPAQVQVDLIPAGADAGKYLVRVETLLEVNADTTQNFTYVDVDNSGTFTTGDIKVATGSAVAGGFANLTAPVFSSVKVATVAAPTADDAAGNVIEGNVEKVVK